MAQIRTDASLEQLANGATLPGHRRRRRWRCPTSTRATGCRSAAWWPPMPTHGVVSPGAIGFDINCGVRLLAHGARRAEDGAAARARSSTRSTPRSRPASASAGPRHARAPRELDARDGAAARRGRSARGHGVARRPRAHRVAAAALAGAHARRRVRSTRASAGVRQLGSLGSGNHFLEMQVVDEVYDDAAAQRFGLRAGPAHGDDPHGLARARPPGLHRLPASSPGEALRRYGIAVPDRQLACAPVDSDGGARRTSAPCARRRTSPSPTARCSPTSRARSFARVLGRVAADARDWRRLRRRPQHRQGGGARGRRPPPPAARPPQGRDARVPGPARARARATWAATRSCSSAPRRRCARRSARTCHGAGRAHEPDGGGEGGHAGAGHRRELRGAGRRRARDRPRRARRGDAGGLQGRARTWWTSCTASGSRPRVARLRPLGVIKG